MVFILKDFFVTDIITNSSSEVFVLADGQDEKIVYEAICNLIDVYNRLNNEDLQYNDVFYVQRVTEDNFDRIAGDLIHVPWKRADESWKEYSNRRDLARAKYFNEHRDEYEGKLAVWSVSDNTIPWPIMEFIESMSDRRIYLG